MNDKEYNGVKYTHVHTLSNGTLIYCKEGTGFSKTFQIPTNTLLFVLIKDGVEKCSLWDGFFDNGQKIVDFFS